MRRPLQIVLAFAAGVLAAYVLVTAPFQWYWFKRERTENLGSMLQPDEVTAVLRAYGAEVELDRISWSPRNVPTPFLGAAPMPGRQRGANISAQQFRYDRDLGPKPAGVRRIFVTGGSTAYGSGASATSATIAGVLQELLGSRATARETYEVVTAANPSWASTHERIVIENRLSELDPDLVISLSGNNDIHWGFRGYDVFNLHTYQEQFFLNQLDLLQILTGHGRLERTALPTPESVPPAVVARKLEKNVRLAAHALSLTGGRYLFVLQPTLTLTGKRLSDRERKRLHTDQRPYFGECFRRIRQSVGAIELADFHFLDLVGVFDGLDESEEIFIDSYHFGDLGSRFLAEAMANRVLAIVAGDAAGARTGHRGAADRPARTPESR